MVADLYLKGKRAIPDWAPISFAPRGWMPLILQDGKIDRRAYELCLFSELKRRLDAGDVWVERAKRFQSFESFLIPAPTFELMREEGPLPVAVDTDVETYLKQQRQTLNDGLRDLSRLAEAGELDDVELTGAGFSVTPHKAMFPDIAKALKPKVEGRLPAIRITDLLLEVDGRTGFSNAFTHLRTGRMADNKLALLTAVLADGINLGLTRMADVSPGLTMRQLNVSLRNMVAPTILGFELDARYQDARQALSGLQPDQDWLQRYERIPDELLASPHREMAGSFRGPADRRESLWA